MTLHFQPHRHVDYKSWLAMAKSPGFADVLPVILNSLGSYEFESVSTDSVRHENDLVI
jgi:hypothetical protein